MKRDQLEKLLDDAVAKGGLGKKNYYGDSDAFAEEVIQNVTEKLTKAQKAKLVEFAKFMF